MNILVTGGAGYIGSHVSLNLLNAGYDVTILDDLSNGYEQLIPQKADFIKCNISDVETINSLLQNKKFIAIMHFAGLIKAEESVKFPEKYFTNNSKNSEQLFNICFQNNLSNIIFSSSAAIYGNALHTDLIPETAELRPLNPYGESKVKTEKFLLKQNSKDINFIILRYFNVAGADPLMRSGLISKEPTHLIKIASEAAIGKRDKVIIFGKDYDTHDGTAVRDYIHVSDLAEIHVKSLEYLLKNKQSKIFNCGYGKGYSVKEVIDEINKICNNKINIEYGPRRLGDAISLISDITKLKQHIDWMPKYNNLNFILNTAIKWELKLKNEKIF